MAAPITVSDVNAYLGESSWSSPSASAQVQGAIDAEYANQLRKCRVIGASASYPVDLREALLRRTARNLAMRSAPLAVMPGPDGETVAGFIPRMDSEIRRYESPWIRIVVG